MFAKLDAEINRSASVDYWSDVGIDVCAAILCDFNQEDWIKLGEEIPIKSAEWISRCADALGSVPEKRSLDLLMEIATSDDSNVLVTALDCINSLFVMGMPIADHSQFLIERINTARPLASRIELIALASLEGNLTGETPVNFLESAKKAFEI